jgi:transcriptional regulator with XRE-family HTH domain
MPRAYDAIMNKPKTSTQPKEGADLRTWRERTGVNQSELARRAGIKQSLLSRLEAGKRVFTKDSSERIYKAVKELNAERAQRLTAIALNRDSQSFALELLRDKKTPTRDVKRMALIVADENAAMRAQLQAYREKEKLEIGPAIAELREQIMEQEIKPLTAELNKVRHELADMRRLVGMKTEAVAKEAEAEDLQQEIEQRVRREGKE